MKLKKVYLLLAGLLLLISLSGAKTIEKGKATQDKPNIIFVLVDDLGYTDINRFDPQNRSYYETPHIDKLAKQGMMFTQAYANAANCAPSRTSLLQGVHQGHADVRDNQFDKALPNNHNLATVEGSRLQHQNCRKVGAAGGDDRWNENGSDWPAYPTKRGFTRTSIVADQFYTRTKTE